MSTTTTPETTTAAKGASGKAGSPAPTGTDVVADQATHGAVSPLASDQGTTTIAAVVVEKIAGMAAREVAGVYKLGSGTARTLGAIRERIPGQKASVGQGVAVEVGTRQAAVDLTLVPYYGVSIAQVADAVRQNVVDSLQDMTGLEVTEVNIAVVDIRLPDEDDSDADAPATGGGSSRVA